VFIFHSLLLIVFVTLFLLCLSFTFFNFLKTFFLCFRYVYHFLHSLNGMPFPSLFILNFFFFLSLSANSLMEKRSNCISKTLIECWSSELRSNKNSNKSISLNEIQLNLSLVFKSQKSNVLLIWTFAFV
jgi:hypothetical protein